MYCNKYINVHSLFLLFMKIVIMWLLLKFIISALRPQIPTVEKKKVLSWNSSMIRFEAMSFFCLSFEA